MNAKLSILRQIRERHERFHRPYIGRPFNRCLMCRAVVRAVYRAAGFTGTTESDGTGFRTCKEVTRRSKVPVEMPEPFSSPTHAKNHPLTDCKGETRQNLTQPARQDTLGAMYAANGAFHT
jgi:hypothetical protein